MHEDAVTDPYDPESYPVKGGFPSHWQLWQDGFAFQWLMLAEHVVDGGDLEAAPYPALDRFDPRFPRSVVEGIQQARFDAADMQRAGVYDAHGILQTLRAEEEERRVMESARALVEGGEYTPPTNPSSVRLHTAVTRLFSDDVVHDVVGMEYKTEHRDTHLLNLEGPLTLYGLREMDLGVRHEGTLRIDVVNGDAGGAGTGVPALRLLWGDPSTIVGAIEAGRIAGPNRWVGIGRPGGSEIFRQESHRVTNLRGALRVVDDERHGETAWLWNAHGGYAIFQVVNAEFEPVGIILDTTGISDFYYFDKEEDAVYIPWPEGAREFHPNRDEPGCPPGFEPPAAPAQEQHGDM